MNANNKQLIQEYDLLVLDSMSKMTRKEYLHNLEQFSRFLESERKDFLQLTALDLALFLKTFKSTCVGKTLQRKYSAIRKFYLFLRKKNLISREEIELLKDTRPKAIKNEEAHKALSDQDIEQCLKTITHPLFWFVFLLGIEFGLHRTEYTRLKTSDIDLKRQRVKIHGKGNKIRFIPIADRLISMFERFFTQRERDNITHNYLLYSKTGKAIGRTIEHYFEQMSLL